MQEIIILAGGLGTRLRSVVPELPKCMAPVNGKPFLSYVTDYFKKQGVERFIFSLGYKHGLMKEYLNEQYSTLPIQYSIENEPLGTGGAIKKACTFTTAKDVLVVNGDTFFAVDTSMLIAFHAAHDAHCTLALKPMKDFSRYGVIELGEDDSIKDFKEKKYYKDGLINGGIYVLNVEKFLEKSLPEKFSFETGYLEKFFRNEKMYGVIQDKYFIDIGIPEDYERAKKELETFDF